MCTGVEECPATMLRGVKVFLSLAFVFTFLSTNRITGYVAI